MINAICQCKIFSSITALVAILKGMSWVYFHELSTSIYCFVCKTVKEQTPSCISYRFSKAMILYHIENHQIFNAYYSKPFDYLTTLLMSKVSALICYSLMYTRYLLAFLLTLFTPFRLSRKLSLCFSKFLFFLAKES